MNKILLYCLLIISQASNGQTLGKLTVDKIMRDQKWIGTSPSNPTWSHDSKSLYFNWNPEKTISDSVYVVTLADRTPKKTTPEQRDARIPSNAVLNNSKTVYVYGRNG